MISLMIALALIVGYFKVGTLLAHHYAPRVRARVDETWSFESSRKESFAMIYWATIFFWPVRAFYETVIIGGGVFTRADMVYQSVDPKRVERMQSRIDELERELKIR